MVVTWLATAVVCVVRSVASCLPGIGFYSCWGRGRLVVSAFVDDGFAASKGGGHREGGGLAVEGRVAKRHHTMRWRMSWVVTGYAVSVVEPPGP